MPRAALARRQPSRFSRDRRLAARRRMAIYPMCGVCRQQGTVMLILNVMLLMAFLIVAAISLLEVLDFRHAGE
jgi:hypothetical protein